MKPYLLLFAAAAAVAFAGVDGEKCYENVGCFSRSWRFAKFRQPKSPEEIGLKFLLFTRFNREDSELITFKEDSITGSQFRGWRKSVFIIHGYLSYSDKPWIKDMKDALLDRDDLNVIVVNWKKGARWLYDQAVANTKVVGHATAAMIQRLHSDAGSSVERTHIIGHSLGAHAAGFASRRTSRLARITGLDPAGPSFKRKDVNLRLDKSDADFVDVIHSDDDKMGFNNNKLVGHADFYPNGGNDQPGCAFKMLCDHRMSYKFMIASIKRGRSSFPAYPCSSYDDYKSEICTNSTNEMGYFARKPASPTGYYLDTEEASRFGSL